MCKTGVSSTKQSARSGRDDSTPGLGKGARKLQSTGEYLQALVEEATPLKPKKEPKIAQTEQKGKETPLMNYFADEMPRRDSQTKTSKVKQRLGSALKQA